MSISIEPSLKRQIAIEQLYLRYDAMGVDWCMGHDAKEGASQHEIDKAAATKAVYDAADVAEKAAKALADANHALTLALLTRREFGS